jgi:hypothetical protein
MVTVMMVTVMVVAGRRGDPVGVGTCDRHVAGGHDGSTSRRHENEDRGADRA